MKEEAFRGFCMTSASELFYTRRSRCRGSAVDLGLDSCLDRSFPHHHHHDAQRSRRHHNRLNLNSGDDDNNAYRDRCCLDGCDRLRRPPLARHQPRRTTYTEHCAVRPEGTILANPINLDNFGGRSDRLRFHGSERLPGAVVLARQRLLERLRGVTQSRNRASSVINQNDLVIGDYFSPVDEGDWETEISRERLARSTLLTESVSPTDQLLNGKKQPGLSQEALNSLQVEVFGNGNCREGDIRKTSEECSVCLENFLEGDKLISLPCAHSFHASCLLPWVRTCGNCPCCRKGVVF